MKIGILATGITPDELLGEHGAYADMFVTLLNKVDKQQGQTPFDFVTFDVRDDIFPDSADQCEGWIVTGSKFGVYDNLPWMSKLKTLIHEIYDAEKPMLGICFGHQIIADAFGGKVEKFSGGWGIGLQHYQCTAPIPFAKHTPDSFTISAMHQDQVMKKPEIAEVVATSDFCKYAGLKYGQRILTFQGHPEFETVYADALILARKGHVIPHETADKGLATLHDEHAVIDSLEVGAWMSGFLRQNER